MIGIEKLGVNGYGIVVKNLIRIYACFFLIDHFKL